MALRRGTGGYGAASERKSHSWCWSNCTSSSSSACPEAPGLSQACVFWNFWSEGRGSEHSVYLGLIWLVASCQPRFFWEVFPWDRCLGSPYGVFLVLLHAPALGLQGEEPTTLSNHLLLERQHDEANRGRRRRG